MQGARRRTGRQARLPRRHGRLRRQPQRVLRDHPQAAPPTPSSATTTPRSPAAWTTRTTTTPRATRSTCTRGCSRPRTCSGCKELPYEVREGDVHFCHGSPVNLEEFEYIFAPEQAAQCLDIWDDLAPLTLIGHSHLCKSFALTPDDVYEVVVRSLRAAPGLEVHRQRRLGRPAARLRPARQLHALRHRQEAVRVQARRVRHRGVGGEDLRRRPRAELRPPPLHRRLRRLT